MASLNLIMGFDALIQDTSIGVSNFGIVGVVCHHTLSSVVRSYPPSSDGLAAMVADGFSVNDYAYLAVSAIAKQSPRTNLVKIYRRDTPNVQALSIAPATLTQGTVYTFKINGITVSRANGAAETATTWCTAWQAILTGAPILATNVTSTNNTTFLTLTQTVATGRRIYLDEIPLYMNVKDLSPDAGIATALNLALATDSDFYGVAIDGMSEAENAAAASWCEANKRVFHGLTADFDTLTSSTTDVASDFVAAAFTYGGVFFTTNMSELWNVALLGRQLGLTPGSNSWENVPLAGVRADNLTATQITNGKVKKLGMYLPFKTPVSSVNATHNISAGSGRFFDSSRDRDWFVANTQAALVAEQIRLEKVPANQKGLDIHESVVRTWLDQAEKATVIDPGWTLSFPKAADLPNLKATRRYTASNAFFAYLTGSINGGEVTGIFSV